MDFIKNLLELLQKGIPPIHKEGQPFVFIFIVVSFLLGILFEPLGWLGAIATLWCIYFFRDPARAVPQDEGFVLSPADGLVQKIELASPPAELGLGDAEVIRISIFLNVFDVHVNRIPIAGEVTELNYRPGKFLSANLDKASEENERQSVVVQTADGKKIVFVQIAGLIARRIVCDLTEGQKVESGDRYGIIRFGSRVDVYLPEGVESLAVAGQRAVGGETILADLNGKQSARRGEIK